MLIVKSAVKDFLASNKLRMGQDLLEALDKEIMMHLTRAIKRAHDNNRTTVQGRDL